MNYFYAKFPAADGAYVDADNIRYDLSVVRRVRDPQGVNVGYTEFPSLEAALKHWQLTPFVEPEPSTETN